MRKGCLWWGIAAGAFVGWFLGYQFAASIAISSRWDWGQVLGVAAIGAALGAAPGLLLLVADIIGGRKPPPSADR